MCGEQFCGQVLLREAIPGKRLSEKKGLKQFGFGFDPPPTQGFQNLNLKISQYLKKKNAFLFHV